MMLCILASCSDGGGEEPITPTPKPEEVKTEITIDSGIISNGLSFDSTGGEQSVSFSVNADWTLSIASTTSGITWCKASITSGSKGTINVKFTVSENTDYEDRSVSVTIKAGSINKTFTITQKSADALLITTNKYEVAQEGGQIEIEVKTNIDYKMEISEEAKDWIKESSGRALTTYKHKLDIAMNEDAEKREGEITFKSGDKVETVKVYQAGGAILLLSQNECYVSDKGDTISVDIKSNIDFGIQMPDVDWIIDEASSRGMSSHTLKYIVSANEGYDSRSTEIVFYDKNSDLKDTLKVVQAQKDAIILSEKEMIIEKEGGIVDVIINTNVDFEVQIPSDVTWVTYKSSRSLTEKTFYLKIAYNPNDESRSTNIIVTNEKSQLSETFVITQHGQITVATLDVAGTLKSFLGNDYLDIESLRVVGPINGDDIYCLRKMLGAESFSEADWGSLTTLDLSEAFIVKGGEWYYKNHYTSKNVIDDYMFYRCTNLQSIVLPNTITSIRDYAFSGCDALVSINIPERVKSIGNYAFSSCDALSSIDIPDNVTSMGDGVFFSCSSLNTINLPNGLTSIGESAFSCCRVLTSIDIPKSVTSIGKSAFVECDALTSIDIPDNVSSIGNRAFELCSSLKTVIFGNGIKTIGNDAFGYCWNLKKVYCYATTPPECGDSVFEDPSNTGATLYVPLRCGAKYKSSRSWGNYFKNIKEME